MINFPLSPVIEVEIYMHEVNGYYGISLFHKENKEGDVSEFTFLKDLNRGSVSLIFDKLQNEGYRLVVPNGQEIHGRKGGRYELG